MLKATGQESVVPEEYGLEKEERGGRIKVNPETLATAKEGVFAGGDSVSGPASVIEAIAAGRQAAIAIDKYLGGQGNLDEIVALPPEEEVTPIDMDAVEGEKHRPAMDMLSSDERVRSYAQVVLGFDPSRAIEETKRCLRCDLEEH